MKMLSIILIAGVVLFAYIIPKNIIANYKFEKNYLQLWELADKSSTIPAKQKYISEFVSVLEKDKDKFATHNAIFLKTPNNELVSNLNALKTLADRLSQIQEMNPNTFEYNTAIQQITAQEQGEAKALISVIRGCYYLETYPSIWGWIGATLIFLGILLCGIGGIGIFCKLIEMY